MPSSHHLEAESATSLVCCPVLLLCCLPRQGTETEMKTQITNKRCSKQARVIWSGGGGGGGGGMPVPCQSM